MIDHRPSSADKALLSALQDTKLHIGGNSNAEQASAAEHASKIVQSGIQAQADNSPMVHLYRFKAWFTPPGSPLPAEGTMVADRVCAANWDEAEAKIRARLVESCKLNKLPETAYQIGKLEVIELDLPVSK